MKKHKHSIRYSKLDLQLTGLILMALFYFVPATSAIYFFHNYLQPNGLPENNFLAWLYFGLSIYAAFFIFLINHLLIVGLTYRLVPSPTIGKRVPTFSTDWLLWGIKAEIWKMTADVTIIFSIVLKIYLLRYLFFKLIGLKIHPTSMIATDVRIYDPHLLRIGKNCLLPVYSIFSGHLITGNTMYMKEIIIGDNVSVGARSGFAPGVEIGDNTTLGFATLFGLNVKVGIGCMIDSRSSFADDVVLGEKVFIGKNCFLGRKVHVAGGLRIPDNCNIPNKAKLLSKQDVIKYCINRA